MTQPYCSCRFIVARILALFLVISGVFLTSCGDSSTTTKKESATAAKTFEFEENDSICLVGNALAERAQHHGWLEAYLQHSRPSLNLSFRNLGFGADEIKTQQRTSGFGTMDDYLKHCVVCWRRRVGQIRERSLVVHETHS